MALPLRRWCWLLPAALLLTGLGRLRFDVEILNLLPGDLPLVRGLQLYQEHFAETRELIITLEAPDAESATVAARSLAESLQSANQLVRDVAWQSPGSEDPQAVAEFIAYLWLNQPEETVTSLTKRLTPDVVRSTLTEAREELATALSPATLGRLSYDPLLLTEVPDWSLPVGPGGSGQELFASVDGRFRALFVQGPESLADYQDCSVWLTEVRRWVAEWESRWAADRWPEAAERKGLRIQFTGQPAFMAEIGGGMQRDLVRTVSGMFVVIGLLFWLTHRRWVPLLKLLIMLGVILAGTLALGGLVFGKLNVVSVGFAAMLLALAVDYGLVLYQESKISPETRASALRAVLGPGIGWAALTTAGAFLAASTAHLPGLVQMGTLVGAGILLSAAIMLYLYLPWIVGTRDPTQPEQLRPREPSDQPPQPRGALRLAVTAGMLLTALGILAFGQPEVDRGTEALRPANSQAYAALAELKRQLDRGEEPYWLILAAEDDPDMIRRLREVHHTLQTAVDQDQIAGFTLPHGLWPNPDHQAQNRLRLATQLPDRSALVRLALESGFTERSMALTERILEVWKSATESEGDVWLPSGRVAQWALERLSDRSNHPYFALGLIHPAPGRSLPDALAQSFVGADRTWLASWDGLGLSLLRQVKRDLSVILPIVAVVLLVTLSCTFRRASEVLLGLAALGMSLLVLQAVMKLSGWSWNLMNVVALPVLLGTGVDYGIHMQLALRRHQGNWRTAHRGVGKALLLCGVTTIAGFASLMVSSNSGLASLGRICAVGMAATVVTTVFLLPAWWSRWATASPSGITKRRPSRLYRAEIWRLGLAVGRWTPVALMRWLGWWGANLFWVLGRERRAVVTRNLEPVSVSPELARQNAHRLYHQFAQKLVDLWLYESGRDLHSLFGELRNSDRVQAALQSGKGILLVTPHLGNWELGGPIMARHGVKLLALTLAEPHAPLTELRIQARARHGIETLVIQQDPFAFLEVVRRLDRGEFVALLVDRPPSTVATRVSLCGRSIAASLAPAELARASGCLILPVYILKGPDGRYRASVLPPIDYDRATLRSPEAKRQLAQEIQRAFEPVIRQHPDQWYHFVPIWSDSAGEPVTDGARESG